MSETETAAPQNFPIYHAQDGVTFQRQQDGAVCIAQHFDGPERSGPRSLLVIPATVWASIVASVSLRGESGESYRAALAFHESETTRG